MRTKHINFPRLYSVNITPNPLLPKRKNVTSTLSIARENVSSPTTNIFRREYLVSLSLPFKTFENFPKFKREKASKKREKVSRTSMAFTKERENFVYIAKLAEQAERYEGPFSL
jgi:hypothetical protein